MLNARPRTALALLAVVLPVGAAVAQAFTFTMERIYVDPSTNVGYAVGKGQAIVPPDLVLSGGSLTAISSESLSIGDIKLQVLKSTKFCLANGKRASASAFKTSDAVLVTSKVGSTAALSVRAGEMMSPMSATGTSGEMRRNYVCN
jgi:hypothetical protein